MKLGGEQCLRIFLFILIAGLCISQLANGRKQKQSPENEKLEIKKPPTNFTKVLNGEIYNHVDVYQQQAFDHQTTREGGLFDNTSKRKTLIVWMRSLASGTRGLTVYDSGELVYRFDNYPGKHSQEVRLYNPLGEVVFTICRKKYLLARPWWEGYKGSGCRERAWFRVKEYSSHGLYDRKSTLCEVDKYGSSSYSLQPCRIAKSSNAKFEFKLINSEGQTIAKLKQKHGDGEVPPGPDVFSFDLEAEADVAFVVALVAVFGMINHKI